MKKAIKGFSFILAAALLTACQGDIENIKESDTASSISEAVETTKASANEDDSIPKLSIKTDKPFVLAEAQYTIEKQELDVSLLNQYNFSGVFADSNYYCSERTPGILYYSTIYGEGETPVEKASITVYNSDTGEYSTIYSEAPIDDEHGLSFSIIGLYDSFLYYYRNEIRLYAQIGTLELCRLNLKDKTSERLFNFSKDNIASPALPVRSGDFLYFYDVHDVDWEKNEGTWTIYRSDINTGKTVVFRDNAERPLPYKNGIIYYHNGGFYYHGEDTDVTGEGIFYEYDELIYYPNPEGEMMISGINSYKDTVIYTYFIYDDEEPDLAIGSVFGIFDEDFKRVDLASTENNIFWYIGAGSCTISESGLIYINGGSKPLIYDTENECFAVIPGDNTSYYNSYASEDGGICFFGCNQNNDGEYTSAAIYTVKRR